MAEGVWVVQEGGWEGGKVEAAGGWGEGKEGAGEACSELCMSTCR